MSHTPPRLTVILQVRRFMNITQQSYIIDIAVYNRDDIHNLDIDWDVVYANRTTAPIGVICKATEWCNEDATFGRNWQALGRLGIPRGAYCFYRNGQLLMSAGRQAKHFFSTIQKYGGIKPNDILIIDDEERYANGTSKLSAKEMIDFLWTVQTSFGLPDTSQLMIYSTADLLNNLSLVKINQAQQSYLKSVKIWTAGYPTDPTKFDIIPPAYIPDNRWAMPSLWQWAENFIVSNIYGGSDMNYATPEFLQWWGASVTPPVDAEHAAFDAWMENHPKPSQYEIWLGAKGKLK